MSLFDRILTQPIFNLLAFIFNFVGDFGIAVIIVTIIIRLILWPLIKRQLYQTRAMRSIQPQLKEIKKKANGNAMLESTMMMELYKEKNIKPFTSMLVVLIQLPILIALFRVVEIYSGAYNVKGGAHADQLIYPFLANFGRIPTLLKGNDLKLFGVIDIARRTANYLPALLIAVAAAVLQYFQSKQLMSDGQDHKKLSEMFKDAADGKEVDQAEMMQASNRSMLIMGPIMTFMISLALPGTVVLYYATSSLIAILQQRHVLNMDEAEMEKIANRKTRRKAKKSRREKNAKEAVVVKKKDFQSGKVAQAKTDTKKSPDGKVVVRRIKAK